MTYAMTFPRLALLGLTVTLLAPGCAEDDPPPDDAQDDAVRAYLIDTWGITATGFDDWDGTQFTVLDDGTAVSNGRGNIHVEGLGSQAVIVDEEVAPQSFGGLTTVVIAEPDAPDDDAIYMTFDPVTSRLAFGDGTVRMGIDANPDGSFHVWRFLPETGVEETLAMTDAVGSYQHVEANGGLEGDSPYLLLMAFVLGQSPAYEARTLVHCNVNDVASPPVPCNVFRTFCECVACHAKDGIGCTPCPTLDP